MNRCTNIAIGEKILSYDLLDGLERHEVDLHLRECAACRDFREQTLGQEGALDDLAARVWRLGRRQRVAPHEWLFERMRDLSLPLLGISILVIGFLVWLSQRTPETPPVALLRFAILRGATLDSLATPQVDPAPEAVVLRTDQPARASVYESREGTIRRIVPAAGGAPPEIGPAEGKEVPLPHILSRDSRLLVMLVPAGAPGTLAEWDDALFAQLNAGRNPESAAKTAWPGEARPTLRWYP